MRILNLSVPNMEDFICLAPQDEQQQEEGSNRQTQAPSATTAVASQDPPQDGPSTMASTTKASSDDDFIDLEEGQFPSEPETNDEQTQAVDGINAMEPLAFQRQPQDRPPPSAIDSTKALLHTQAPGATAAQVVASEYQSQDGPGTVDSTTKPSSSDDFIDLEEGQFASEPDAKDGHTEPQRRTSTVDSTKASVHVIDLEQGQVVCEAGVEDAHKGSSLQANALVLNGVEPLASSEHQPQDAPSASDGTKASDGIIDLEEGQVEDMDLSDDDVVVVKNQPLDAPVHAKTSVPPALQTIRGVPVVIDKGPGIVTPLHASSSAFIDETPTKGVKRARVESAEPSVCVVYNNLTRQSKRRLMELMQQWSEWQARNQHSLTESVEEILECGEETYYPALHVGSERYAVSFCVDYQARENIAMDDCTVPLYNREFTLGSTPLGDSANTESKKDNDDSRCFNCGSYSHALKECPKPRDHVAISNARKQHNLKRNLSNGNRAQQNRYYQKTPGKFDDLKAGVLGSETRECLGLRENDPPPWLHRMRELGYPPGYLDEVEDEDKPSGITIFGDGGAKVDHEDGELPEKDESSPPRKKMTVEFPGINAPVPENGDPWLWGSTPPQSSSGRHHHPSSDSRDRGLLVNPGAEHYPSSRYHPYDHGGPATPGLARSHSDRGRRSSSGYYENPPPPPPGEDSPWTPHSYSSRQHSSSSERHLRDRERERERDRHYYSSRR